MRQPGQHVMIRLESNDEIVSTPEERRIASRVVLEMSRDLDLLCFGIVDEHLHLELLCEQIAARELARRIELSLHHKLALQDRFQTARIKPIQDRRHRYRLFGYILTQNRHHGLRWDPGLESTNLPDLLGLRLLGAFTRPAVARWLPRVCHQELLGYLGVGEIEPSNEPVDAIVDATLAALPRTNLAGRSPEVSAARCAAVHVVGLRRPRPWLASQLGVSLRTVGYLRSQRPDPALVSAIRLQLGLRSKLAERDSAQALL